MQEDLLSYGYCFAVVLMMVLRSELELLKDKTNSNSSKPCESEGKTNKRKVNLSL
jgi:hypothetical protein